MAPPQVNGEAPAAAADPRGGAPLLAARGLTKTFPGVRALCDVSFTLRAGQIHALMGENGAGKSTLIKVLTGALAPDAGQILLDGRPVAPRSPIEAQRLGVSTVYQEINLIPGLSVAENLFLGRQPMRFGRIDTRAIRQGARRALARLNLDLDVTRPLAACSIAVQQLVAIARALDLSARALILDEPTSSLDAGEVDQLFRTLRTLREKGLGIVFITHFIDQVYAIADRITVLRNGRLVGEYPAADLPKRELVSRMIGRAFDGQGGGQGGNGGTGESPRQPSSAAAAPLSETESPVLSARALARRHAIHPVDLDIRRGEVVGLAGLLGSGRTELARLLFGLDRADAGQIWISGRKVGRRGRLHSPRAAIRRGLAMLPEDRKTQGLVAELSIRENIVLALQGRRGWLRPLRRRTQRALADKYIRALGIATPSAEKPIGQLSGGNQQKAILARWLATNPILLILDEPTRGVDVGAKAEIEKLIAELCEAGLAILFISAELDEVVRSSRRIIALRDRRKVGELSGPQVTESRLIAVIAGEERRPPRDEGRRA